MVEFAKVRPQRPGAEITDLNRLLSEAGDLNAAAGLGLA